MANEELDKILGGQTEDPSSDGAGKNQEPEKKPDEVLNEEQQKKQELYNINKAIKVANDELNRIRKEKKEVSGKSEEDVPKINFEDPSSKAWDKHIKETVDPVTQELDAEKQEIFKFTLKDFLNAHPSLATNTDGLNRVVQTYERIKNNTGRTKEGVINDLSRAYAAEFHEELQQDNTKRRIDKARKDALYGDAGVSRGAGSYLLERESDPVYSDEDAAILAKWGMTPQSHSDMVKALNEKEKIAAK